MNAISLFSRALDAPPELPEEPTEGLCCITGESGPTIPRKHLITQSFTQLDQLARPESDRVSADAWMAWRYGVRREGKARDFRPECMSSWLITDKLTLLDRQGVRNSVLNPPIDCHWAGYATTSYKKHGSILAPVNSGAKAVWLWELIKVDCSDKRVVRGYWDTLRQYQDAGIPRPVLESADIDAPLIKKLGIDVFMDFTTWAKPIKDSPLYQFLCYLLPSMEELRELNQR